MKDLSACMITIEITKKDVWNELKIRERTSEFSDEIKKIWNIVFV